MYLHSRTQAASGYCVELDACNKTKIVSLSRRVDPVRALVCLPKWMQARRTVANIQDAGRCAFVAERR